MGYHDFPMWILEMDLAFRQPLLDLGWRVDHKLRGIVRPGTFIPLADLKAATETRCYDPRPDGATITSDGGLRHPGSGQWSLPLHAVLDAIDSLESEDGI